MKAPRSVASSTASQSSQHVRLLPHPPTRSARASCSERLACRGPNPCARVFCSECGTNQCEACELLIHEEPRFRHHRDRSPLEPPEPFLLCQGAHCSAENLADLRCQTCQRSLCYSCDQREHLVNRKLAHTKTRFQHYLERLQREEEEEEEYLSADGSFTEAAMMSLELMGPDILSDARSLEAQENKKAPRPSSFLLVDDKEVLQVSSPEEFSRRLGCGVDRPVKVLSIFGNTGEGKSHTLNQTFFGGAPVFRTSSQQQSCTVGAWAALCPDTGLVAIDTEGLLGVAQNQNQRTRLLLKVLAISDVVIYRTRAERLHSDLFSFLGDASQAYASHFSQELKALKERCNIAGPVSVLGPAVVVFHETMHTKPLSGDDGRSVTDILRRRFDSAEKSIDAFSALDYVGIQTKQLPTCFDGLREVVEKIVDNSTVRSARPVEVIFQALRLLNEKFSGDIDRSIPSSFPDQFFTCQCTCIACSARCNRSMNHQGSHRCDTKCQYQHEHDNKVFVCKSCYEKSGREIVLTPQTGAKNDAAWMGWAKYAWSGYILECPSCGVIFQSRQYWYGNKNPEETVVRTEITHLWPGEPPPAGEPSNTAQRVIDGLQVFTETVSSISAGPTRTISDWVTDQIAPVYWVPNYKIQHCHDCGQCFSPNDRKHHCRACGQGFCDDCSSQKRPVPERGWPDPVRVCKACFNPGEDEDRSRAVVQPAGESEVTARKVGEVIRNVLGVAASAIEFPLGLIKDTARPAYWTPDHELSACAVCELPFGPRKPIHHCRGCGLGVCNDCSMARRPVASRGWESPVRICDKCDKRSEL